MRRAEFKLPVPKEAAWGHISRWNTSGVTDMQKCFAEWKTFSEDLSVWDTSSVTNMKWMFGYCSAFNQPLASWDTSSVTGMQ